MHNDISEKVSFLKYTLLTVCNTAFFYILYLLFYTQIHKENFIDPTILNPWHRLYINHHEGNELLYMLTTSFLFIAIQYMIIKNLKKIEPYLTPKKITLSLLVATLLIITTISIYYFKGIRPEIRFSLDRNLTNNIIIMLGTTLLILSGLKIYSPKIQPKHQRTYTLLLITGITILVLLFSYEPHLWDTDFFTAPALKILQGEKLGTFYMQYNLLLTLLIAGLLKLKLHLNQISFAFSIVFLLWLSLYWYIAKKLISDKRIQFLFIISIVIYRFLSHIPISPQGTSLRHDLWALLIAIALRFGLYSMATCITVSLLYILDNHYGLLYMILYIPLFYFHNHPNLFSNLKVSIKGSPTQLRNIITKQDYKLLILAPAILFNIYYFHSIFSQGVVLYRNLRLTFTPISIVSLYWLVLILFGLYLYTALKSTKSKSIRILLSLLALVQLVHFYGRSYELNLVHISAILLLLFYIGINDSIIEHYQGKTTKITLALITLLLVYSNVYFSQYIITRTMFAKQTLANHTLPTHEFDKLISTYPQPFAPYTKQTEPLIIGAYDGYLNYRYKLTQQGYYAQFWTAPYREDTTRYIYEKLNKGHTVYFLKGDYHHLFFFGGELELYIPEINKSTFLKQQKKHFIVTSLNNNLFNQLTLSDN
jgi:hypothetical protein